MQNSRSLKQKHLEYRLFYMSCYRCVESIYKKPAGQYLRPEDCDWTSPLQILTSEAKIISKGTKNVLVGPP